MADLPQPYFDPSQYPAYLDAQRKQQVAQMLLGSLQQANQTPAEWNSMRQVPKRGMLQNVSALADALLAKKGLDSANQSASSYMQGLYGGAQAPAGGAPAATGPGAGIVSPDAPPAAQAAAQAVTNQRPAGIAAPGGVAPQNPMLPPGMSRQQATMLMNIPGGPAELAKVATARFMPTDMQKNDAYMGLTPQQRQVATLSDALRGAVVPGSTATLGMDAQGNIQPNLIPGLQGNQAALSAANTAATEAQKPHYEQDPFHPGRVITTFPTPPAYTGPVAVAHAGAPSGNGGGTAGDLETMKSAATAGTAAAQKYAADMNEKAAASVDALQTLSEMKNLAQGFQPGKFAPMISGMGAVAQALGVDPKIVQDVTNINPGDAEAFQKGTARLAAEAAKQISAKGGTQAEFKTFLANNPNWMMTPDGLKRVIDYMEKGANQTIDMQQRFAKYTKTPGADPSRWHIDFPAEYNGQTVEDIRNGKLNSAPAPQTGVRTRSDVTAQAGGNAPVITSKAEYDKLAPGSTFIQNGKQWVKPGPQKPAP